MFSSYDLLECLNSNNQKIIVFKMTLFAVKSLANAYPKLSAKNLSFLKAIPGKLFNSVHLKF
jgi:hypothetical protein